MKFNVASVQNNKFGIMHYLHKLFDPPVLFAEKELSEQMAGLRLFFYCMGTQIQGLRLIFVFCMWKPVWPSPEKLTFVSGASSCGLS